MSFRNCVYSHGRSLAWRRTRSLALIASFFSLLIICVILSSCVNTAEKGKGVFQNMPQKIYTFRLPESSFRETKDDPPAVTIESVLKRIGMQDYEVTPFIEKIRTGG
jgi:predicted small secreted protein